MVLVTGPTGSGKTTTLYSCLSRVNKPGINIMTAEDPVEYNLDGINQVQVKRRRSVSPSRPLSRHSCARIPTSSWSVRFVTWRRGAIAVKAALTGHLVLSAPFTPTMPPRRSIE